MARLWNALWRFVSFVLSAIAIFTLVLWPLSYWHSQQLEVSHSAIHSGLQTEWSFVIAWEKGQITAGVRTMKDHQKHIGNLTDAQRQSGWHANLASRGWIYLDYWHENIGPLRWVLLTNDDRSSRLWCYASAPCWLLVLVSGISPTITMLHWIRRRRRKGVGCCPVCGYDLRATPDRCPECGTLQTFVDSSAAGKH